MHPVSIISELTGVTSNVQASEVTLSAPSVVKLQLERSDIASITRTGQDMVIRLHSGETITIKNFYETSQGTSHLVLEDSQGALWWVQDPGSALHFQQIENFDAFMIADGHSEGGAIWPWVLGGVAVAAGIGLAAGGGGGGGGGGSDHHSSDSNSSGNGSGNGSVSGSGSNTSGNGSTDPADPKDTTPPGAPTNLVVSPDGTTVTGKAEAGSTVEVKDANGNVLGKGTADNDGNFSVTLSNPQISGEHLSVDATDKAGNTSPPASVTAPNVDLPETPVITSAFDEHTSIPTPLTNNQYTSDNTPLLKGTGTAGSTVHIFENGHQIGTTVVGSDGNWSFTITSPLADGAYAFTAIAYNIKGNSLESSHFTLHIDTTAPDAPQLQAVTDDVGPIVGNLQNGAITDDAKPTFSGKGEAGDTVTFYDGQTVIGTTTVDASGNWSFTPSQALSETTHTITLTQTDLAGNVSAITTAPTFTVDVTPPNPPIISTISYDGTTVTGNAEAGSTVSIYGSGNVLLGSTVVKDDGSFTITLNPAQTHSEPLEARIQDVAGNVGHPTDFMGSDSGYPPQPVIVSVNDDVAPATGSIASGGYTNDTTPTLSGTAEPNAFITVSDNGTPLFPVVQADSSGNWTFTPIPPLMDGDHIFTATQNNGIGVSGPSTSFSIDVDTQIPILDHLQVINQGQTLTGTTEAGSTVIVKDSFGTQLGTGTADQNGNFSITLSSPKTNGESLTVSVTDRAANVGMPENVIAPDITPPAAPTGLAVTADGLFVTGHAEAGSLVTITDSNGNVLGTGLTNSSGNFIASLNSPQLNGQGLFAVAEDAAHNKSLPSGVVAPDITPPDAPDHLLVNAAGTQLTGHAEAGSTISVKDPEGHVIGTGKAGSDGQFTIALSPAQDNGEILSATATDLSGNTSLPGYATAPDTTPPAIPVILDVYDDVPGIVGTVLNGHTTNDSKPTLSGTAEAGTTVKVYDNGSYLGLATFDSAGHWTFTPGTALSEGSHQFTVTSADAAGNVSTSVPWTILVDTVAPQAPTITLVYDDAPGIIGPVANGGLTNDSTPTVSGSGQPGSVVHLFDNGNLLADITVSASGTWSWTISPALEGSLHSLTVNASDSYGNTSSTSSPWTFTLETDFPATPTIISVTTAGGDAIGYGALTNETKPHIIGKADANAVITLSDNGNIIGTTTADSSGNWTFTLTVALTDGPNNLRAFATDAAGNVSGAVNYPLLVDATAPIAPQVISATIQVSGHDVLLANGSITNQTEPLLKGTAEAGTTIKLYDNGDYLGSALVDAQGKWSFQPGTGFGEGLNVITATSTDTAGNVSPPSSNFSIDIDTVAPATPAAPLVADNVLPVVGYITNGGSTNDTTPTFSGTGEVGSTITIYNGASVLGTTTVNESGNWTFTPGNLAQATYSITTTETDIAGNTSGPSAAVGFTIDTAAPSAPLIDYAVDDVGAPVNINSGGLTSDNTPQLTGRAEAYSTITVTYGNVTLGVTTADSTGHWSLPITQNLPDGPYSFTATATDKAGNVSGPSDAFTLAIDTSVLLPPVVTHIADNVGVIQGDLSSGMSTDDQQLAISGTAQNGTTVVIYDNGSPIGTATVTNGQWSFLTPTLSETTHSFTFTERDFANRESQPTAAVSITVDITAPNNPTISAVQSDGLTISGSAEANSTVIIKDDNGNVLGTGHADGSGAFTLTLTAPQQNGQDLIAIAQDLAGNQSSGLHFPAFNVTQFPNVPVITLVDDNVGPVTGAVTSGGSTDDTTPTLSGTADPGVEVHILIGGVDVATVTATASGTWSYTPSPALLEQTYTFTVFAHNTFGDSGVSAPFTLTIDRSAPSAPDITNAYDDVQPHIGTLTDGALTNDTRPTLNGTSENNATITIFDNGVKIGTTVADGSGAWSFTPTSDIGSTTHIFTAQATDAAGNTGPSSGDFKLVVDALAPSAPTIAAVTNDTTLPAVVVNPGQPTNDNHPVLSGTAEDGSTVNVYDNGSLIGTATSIGGSWSFTFPAGTTLADGSHNLTVTATDPAGNTSAPSQAYLITVDTLPPAMPILNSVMDDQPANVGALINGQLTNDNTPTLNGHGEAGSTITIRVDNLPVGTALVDGTGVWTWTPTTPLLDGKHTFTLYANDPAGNSSGTTTGFTVTVDATAPLAPAITSVVDNTAPVVGVVDNGGFTNETHPVISGTGEAGTTITLYNGATLLGTTTVNPQGNWSFTPTTALAATTWNITATATDAAGNTGPASDVRTFTIDITAPNAPVITTVFDDQGTLTGNLSNGSITDDTRPAISGTSDANARISLYDNGSLLTTVTANSSGVWTYTPTADLTQGNHILSATAADAAGNISSPSNIVTFVVDSLAPLTPVITLLNDDVAPVVGSVVSGGSTNDKTPTLSGTAEAGSTVKIYDGPTLVGTTTADGSGKWTVTTITLGDGPHAFTATSTDTAGNVSGASQAFNVTIDTVAPGMPVVLTVADDVPGGAVGPLTNGQLTNDNTPTLTGTAEAGSTISVYDGSTLLGTTVATGGNWTFTPGSALTDGSHTLTVTATDAAGNVSPPTAGFVVMVDATAPVTPAITSIVDDIPNIVGNVGNGQYTNDANPTLNGTAEANSTVRIYDGSTLLTTLTASGTGTWNWTPTVALSQGNHSFTVTSTDAAGNLSPTSAAATIIVDTIPPGAVTGLAMNGTGTRVTGSAEANSTVTITSSTGTVLGTATADGTGAFTVTLSPAQTIGQTLLAFAQDRAGNVGVSVNFTAPDTRVPDAPAITSVMDDVALYTGTLTNGQLTNDPTPTLNGTAQANATVTIYNNGAFLGTTTANASGVWTYTPTSNMTEGSHAFTATATNANGTGSPSSSISVIIDTTAPSTPTIAISADGGTLSGTAEANSTITITLPGGAGTLTTTTGSNGSWSLTLPVREIEGQKIFATATDQAGNTSGSNSVTAPVLQLSASDNITNLALTSTATTSNQHYTDYGIVLVNALGNVASVLGNNTAAVQFTIANGGSGDVTIDAAATGIVLSLLSTQQIVVQKYDSASGSWTSFIDTGVGNFATLLTLTGSGLVLNLTGLSGGQYRVLTYNTSLLATGSYTNLAVDVHQTSAGTLSGPTQETGNVITDVDPTKGVDNAPTGTVVTQVTNASGVTTAVGAGGATITGLYGTLHINPDGSYSYTLTNTSAGVIGHKDSFTYTISNGVTSDSAQLVVTLGPTPPASSVVTADDSASLVFNTDVMAVNNGASSQSGYTVVGVGLGSVLSLNVLANLTNPIKFDIQDGTTRTMTLQSSVGGVAIASTFDLYIYRFNTATQQYELYQSQKGWLTAPLLGGQSSQLTLTLGGGDYLFLLNTASGLTVLTGYTLNILQDHTYAVDSMTASTTGNVLSNDVLPTDAVITVVNGVAVSATGTTTINGHYGTLTIDAKGNYTYTLKSGVGADSISTPDSFVYTVKAANGDTDSASLNITPTPHTLDAVNDTSAVMTVSTVQDSIAYTSPALGSASIPTLNLSGNGSGSFDVTGNNAILNASLTFKITSLVSLGGLSITYSIIENGNVLYSGTIPAGSISLLSNSVTVPLNGLELNAGHYTVSFTGNLSGIALGTITITPTLTGTTSHLDTFETSSSSVHGNMFDGTDAAGAMDQLNTVHTTLTITGVSSSTATLDPAGSTSSATVQGQYGTLQFNLDGSYTYTLNSNIALSTMTSKETFSYTLNDKNGHTDTATLTINMNPQMVSTDQHDVVTGSAYGDTMIYHLLNNADATGGNGNDEWTNFTIQQGDKIDISQLLTGWDHQASTLGNFVQVTTSGANTVISIDRDGTGSTFHSTTLITLDNVHTSLTELLQQNSIITG
ncbi:BapA prefix-like domain-containing protein [Enterobacteriaceae bacterium RIT691]|nr:BapA prefix-like domain-containing protein [Enterobacteriaceae bacterium RIT691]